MLLVVVEGGAAGEDVLELSPAAPRMAVDGITAERGRTGGPPSLERALTRGCWGSAGTGGEARLSREEMLWFQACCRSMGMILVASMDTQTGKVPMPPFQGRFLSAQVGDGGAAVGLWQPSSPDGTETFRH